MNNKPILTILIIFVVFAACSQEMELRVYPNTVFLEAGEPGDAANVELQISNTGTAPLLHVRLRPQCACYTLAGLSETIAPGESKRFNFAFQYPAQQGDFRERIQVEGASRNGEFVSLSELVVQGKSQRSFALTPSILDIEVSEQVGVVNAVFLIKLFAESTWTDMEVIDITASDVETLSEAMTVSLASVDDGRVILGQCHVDLGVMDFSATPSRAGIIHLRLHTSDREHKLDVPFRITRQRIRVYPEIIRLSNHADALVSVSMPPGLELTGLHLLPRKQSLAFREEVNNKHPLGDSAIYRIEASSLNLSSELRFGQLEFAFSDSRTVRRNFTVSESRSY